LANVIETARRQGMTFLLRSAADVQVSAPGGAV